MLEHDDRASGSSSVSAASDVLILPSSAHEKFTALAEERRRKRARLTGDTPPPPPHPRALKPCPLKDRKQLAFDGLKWLPGTFPHASGCSSFGAAVSASLHHFTPERGGWRGRAGAGGRCRLTVEVGENFSEGIHCPLTESTA